MRPYSNPEAAIIVREMADLLALDLVRKELVTNRDAYAAEKAHMEYSYKAMETDRDTWKRMFEDVTGSKSYKALQTVKGIGRKKG